MSDSDIARNEYFVKKVLYEALKDLKREEGVFAGYHTSESFIISIGIRKSESWEDYDSFAVVYFKLWVKNNTVEVRDTKLNVLETMIIDRKLVPSLDIMASKEKEAYQEMAPVRALIMKYYNMYHNASTVDSTLTWRAIARLANLIEKHVK